MTAPSKLRLHTNAADGLQITGGEDLTPESQFVAAGLAACLEGRLTEWLTIFREHAQEQPAEADVIVAALVEYLRPEWTAPQ